MRTNEKLFWLGLRRTSQGDYAAAEQYFKKVIDISPAYLEAYLWLGHLYLKENKKTEAKQTLAELRDILQSSQGTAKLDFDQQNDLIRLQRDLK